MQIRFANKFRIFASSCALILILFISHPAVSEITNDFYTTQYKDTAATTASWGYCGFVSLPVNELIQTWQGSGTHNPERIRMLDNYAYFSNTTDSFIIFDISNPQSVSYVGSCTTGGAQAKDVVIKDTAAYVGTWSSNVKIIDITNKSTPIIVGGFGVGGGDYEHGLFIDGNRLFTVHYNQAKFRAYYCTSGVPAFVSTLSLPMRYPTKVHYNNNYLYVSKSNDADTFLIIDVTNMSSPSIKGSINFGVESGINNNWSLGSYVFIAGNGDTILRCIDVSDPMNPVQVGYLRAPGSNGSYLRIWGNYAFIGGSKIFVVDISDTAGMDTVCAVSFSTNEIDVYNGYVLTCPSGGSPRMYKIAFANSAVAQSNAVATTAGKIAGAALNAADSIPANTGIQYYLSADEGVHWEGPVTKLSRWSFTYPGTSLRWKAVLSTNDTAITPVMYSVSIDYVYDIDKPSWQGDLTLKTYIDKFDTQKYSSLISWNPVTDSSTIFYEIEQKIGDGGWTSLDTTLATTYTAQNLSNTLKYKFRVRATDVINNSSDWYEISDELSPSWEPSFKIRETDFIMEQGNVRYSVIVSWNTVTDNTGDLVYFEVASKINDADWSGESFSPIAGFEKKNIDGNSAQLMRVRARDVAGNFTQWYELSISRLSSTEINETGGKVSLDDFDGNPDNNAGIDVPKNAFRKKAVFRIVRLPNEEYELQIMDAATGDIIEPVYFNKPVTISIPYKKETVDARGWKEDELGIYYHDKIKWIPIAGIVDKTNRLVKAKVYHFTIFKVGKIKTAGNTLLQTSVDPDIFTPNSDGINDRTVFNLILGDELIDQNGTIAIYDLNGTLVKTISTQGASSIVWDGHNESEHLVEAGVYVYRIVISGKTSGGSITVAK